MNNYYDILNITPNATKTEIVESYQKLKKIYTEDNVAIYGLFSPEMLSEKAQEIELAYQVLSEKTKREKYDSEINDKKIEPLTSREGVIQFKTIKKPEEEYEEKEKVEAGDENEILQEELPIREEYNRFISADYDEPLRGQRLREIRKNTKVSLDEISEETKIKIDILEAIEKEDYAALPARPYLRGFLVLYANLLELDSDIVVRDYLSTYDSWKKDLQ
jgi:DnaJ-class molecular chaperone